VPSTLRAAVAVLSCCALVVAVAALPLGCGRALEPTNRPLETCYRSCEARAGKQCSRDECERGCEFIIDRIVEGEADNVIACVASQERRCTDVVWADCGARVGVHADGGPPAPPSPYEDDE
jgi:hypothetical protein